LKSLTLILCVLTTLTIASFAVGYYAYRHFYLVPWQQEHPWGDFPLPYWRTLYIVPSLAFLTALIVTLTLSLKRRYKLKAGLATAAVLLLIISSFLGGVRYSQGFVDYPSGGSEVDVLVMFDEEFVAKGLDEYETASFIEQVSDLRFAQSNITLVVRNTWHWIYWESPDDTNNCLDLVQSAIQQAHTLEGLQIQKVSVMGIPLWGLVAGSLWKPDPDNPRVTYYIDLLIIYTGQDMDLMGFAPPQLNAIIIRYDQRLSLRTLTHELGHQFGLDHCSNPWCVMNVDWQFGDDFCAECRQKLNDNNGKYPSDWELWFIKPTHGKWVSPALNEDEFFDFWGLKVTFRRFRYDAIVKLEVKPDPNYCFVYYEFTPFIWVGPINGSMPHEKVFENPYYVVKQNLVAKFVNATFKASVKGGGSNPSPLLR